jgi:hypothetical protein
MLALQLMIVGLAPELSAHPEQPFKLAQKGEIPSHLVTLPERHGRSEGFVGGGAAVRGAIARVVGNPVHEVEEGDGVPGVAVIDIVCGGNGEKPGNARIGVVGLGLNLGFNAVITVFGDFCQLNFRRKKHCYDQFGAYSSSFLGENAIFHIF